MELVSTEVLKEQEELHPLINHIQTLFERAALAKNPIESIMIENLYYFKKKYTPDKLKSIREIGGSEIYVPLCNIKCRALMAWLTDIFFPDTGEPPFDIEPTPKPELPRDQMEEFYRDLADTVSDIIQKASALEEITAGQISLDKILPYVKNAVERNKEQFEDELMERSKKLAEKEKQRIYDQFVEGGFFPALKDVFFDLAVYPAAIMKGGVPRRVKAFDENRQPTWKVIPTFNRVNPFDIYPSPDASDFSDWVIEVLHLTPQDLASLKDIEGFDENAIDLILGLYGDTGYSVSQAHYTERRLLEGKSGMSGGLIDVLEFWGSVKGEYISDFISDIEDDEYYEVTVWICDNVVLKATLNPDPLGKKPYCKASFVEIPSSFWGMSLIEVLKDLQDGVNALSRAVINNSALSSGPMVERNIDRIPPNEPKEITPWKIFDSHDYGMATTPAYKFYQPQLTSNAVVQVVMYYMKLADELSGIPPYAHSMVTTGTSGRTASGLSMLMESSARGIKEVVKNIDSGIIEPVVTRQYMYNLINFYENDLNIPDLNIKAVGSITLANKMAQVQKLLQVLQITSNPIDTQIVGTEGRRYLLENIFTNFGLKIPMNNQVDLSQLAGMQQGAVPPKEIPEQTPVQEQAVAMQKEQLQ